MVTQIPIILASNSPRRKELLERAGYTFTVMPSDCDEATDIRFPKDMVMELAGRKAENVYKKVCTDRAGTEAETQPFIVIGSDTVVALNGRILVTIKSGFWPTLSFCRKVVQGSIPRTS